MKFIASTIIFFLLQLPMILLSFVVVPLMLLTKWDGKTTWFGNFKYGRGDTHYRFPAGTFWRQWWFLCVRNPVSNLGKRTLAVKDEPWVWLIDAHVVGRFYFKFGWKNPSGEQPDSRSFVYRPYIKR